MRPRSTSDATADQADGSPSPGPGSCQCRVTQSRSLSIVRGEGGVRLFRQRSSRALLATLAVSALAIVGLDDPTRLPAPVRAELEPTPTPAFSIPVKRPNVLMVTVDDLAVADMRLPPARATPHAEGRGDLRRRAGPLADLRAGPRFTPDRAVRPQPRCAEDQRPERRVLRVRRPGHDRDRAPGRRLRHSLHREVPERIRPGRQSSTCLRAGPTGARRSTRRRTASSGRAWTSTPGSCAPRDTPPTS